MCGLWPPFDGDGVTYGEAQTPNLYHGPEARGKACEEAHRVGRMLCDPIGDGGLKTEDAREAVSIVAAGTIGDATPTLVIGPLDSATPEAADALLKTLEDLSGYVTLCLWAECVGSVIPTIRSRTNAVWCPAGPTWIDPVAPFEPEARRAVGSVFGGNPGTAIRIVEEHGKSGKLVAREELLLRAMCRVLATKVEEHPRKTMALWANIKKALRHPTPLACSAAMVLPEGL